jgi:uncharacterized protein
VVEVELLGLRTVGPSREPVILLQEKAGEHRVVPIFIGRPEADAIDLALRGEEAPRPMTHDLMASLIGELGGVLGQVIVTSLHDHVFHAELVVMSGDSSRRVSARPSDGVALAVRLGAPLFMSESVLDEAGQPAPEAEAVANEAESQEVIDEFRSFLDNISPDDFT